MKLKALDDKKIEILDKLAQAGADTEKKMTALSTDEIFDIITDSNILVQDMHLITDFQKAIKRRRLYSFLADGKDEEEKEDGDRRDAPRNGAGEGDHEDLEDRIERSGDEVDGGAPRLY